MLGKCHEDGRGVPVNTAEAARLYRVGANLGDPEAQWRLGKCLHGGLLDVPPDLNEAYALFTAAAAQDFAPAIQSLGTMYANGRAVKQDYGKAVELYHRASDHPSGMMRQTAAFLLGVSYFAGGAAPVVQDRLRGATDLYEAYALGHPEAPGYMHRHGIELERTVGGVKETVRF